MRWTPLNGTDRADQIGLAFGSNMYGKYSFAGGGADSERSFQPQTGTSATEQLWITGKWKPSHCRAIGDETTSPSPVDWIKDLIMVELRLETFTTVAEYNLQNESIFAQATKQLSYFNDLGITGIVVDPIAQVFSCCDIRKTIFYGPDHPDIIDPRFGTEVEFINFVNTAHSLGIKVMADSVSFFHLTHKMINSQKPRFNMVWELAQII